MTIENNKDGKQRIAKIMARSGLCSRRDAEKIILDGRVKVNGQVINSPALDVSSKDVIVVDGQKLKAQDPTRLWLYHKPTGLVTSHSDPDGRETVFQHIDKSLGRVISVGRLDLTSEGLLLLTNDGELARKLELPATGLSRIYRARAFGTITQEKLDTLKNGIVVEGVKYGSIEATLEHDETKNVWIRVVLKEGKNREIRKVLAALGLKVNRLIRISYGPFDLGELPRGASIEVDESEVQELLNNTNLRDKPVGKTKFIRPEPVAKPFKPAKPNRNAPRAEKPQRPQRSTKSDNKEQWSSRPPKPAQAGRENARGNNKSQSSSAPRNVIKNKRPVR